jgi:hypothetical protein
VTIAMEGQAFTLASAQTVRYGTGSKWTSKVVSGTGECTDAFFGNDKMAGLTMQCQVAADSSALVSAAPAPAPVAAPPPPPLRHRCPTRRWPSRPRAPPRPRRRPSCTAASPSIPPASRCRNRCLERHAHAPGAIPPAPAPGDWEADGAFRLLCNWSKMSYDDPIVYPGQAGRAHHHTFFGNTAIDANTTSENIRSKGNASCRGGTINLSGYWTPSMIDTATGKPIAPKVLLIYYKTGYWQYFNDNSVMQPIPKGLKMIAGDGGRSTAGGVASFGCMMPAVGSDRAGTTGSAIPKNCQPATIVGRVPFPQCWDGVNLDSPDHKSHMAYPVASGPATRTASTDARPRTRSCCRRSRSRRVHIAGRCEHQQVAPLLRQLRPVGARRLFDARRLDERLGSHDQRAVGIKCMRERRNCGAANMGDGRTTLEFQGN